MSVRHGPKYNGGARILHQRFQDIQPELIEESSASSLSGPWAVVNQDIGSGTIPAREGPLLFPGQPRSRKGTFSIFYKC